jgi:hypothetical protein
MPIGRAPPSRSRRGRPSRGPLPLISFLRSSGREVPAYGSLVHIYMDKMHLHMLSLYTLGLLSFSTQIGRDANVRQTGM